MCVYVMVKLFLILQDISFSYLFVKDNIQNNKYYSFLFSKLLQILFNLNKSYYSET